jgi:vesicle-fusing ATPase
VSIEELAARTKNFTGAEIEGVVKAATSYVFTRQVTSTVACPWIRPTNSVVMVTVQVDFSDLSKTADWKSVKVTMADFERALSDVQARDYKYIISETDLHCGSWRFACVQPQFGVKEEELTQCFSNGFINYGDVFEGLVTTVQRLLNQA